MSKGFRGLRPRNLNTGRYILFFSSRRRHTRFDCDWSSDVCSSDLTLLVAAVGGVANFGDLSLNRTATGYTLTASGGGLGPVTSTAFDITPGTATRLAFTQQPTNTVAGGAISPAVQLSALDPAGNLVPTFTGSVTVALGNNPGGSTLGGTTTVAAVGGVVTFSDLTLDKTAPGYWLTATGLGTATSSSFNIIAGPASQLVFGPQPGTTTEGQNLHPAGERTEDDPPLQPHPGHLQ